MNQRIIKVDTAETTSLIFGAYDVNLRIIEDQFPVSLRNKSGEDGTDAIVIAGDSMDAVNMAAAVVEYLRDMVRHTSEITEQSVRYVVDMIAGGNAGELADIGSDCIFVTAKGKPVKAKTVGQSKYVEAIRKNTIVLGVGPAGTGKTFLAVAMAVKALKEKQVSRILLTRPAIEAGERLGFLPGDLLSKIDPYLRPLYDALGEMLGPETHQRLVEKGVIEVAPLAYMRGRTLDDAFIILDEAQNATPEQVKMFLTRLGFGSKVVVTGDLTQTDLPYGQRSGLATAIKILAGIEDIAIHYLSEKDVVRHHLVQKIILAYDAYDREQAARKHNAEARDRRDGDRRDGDRRDGDRRDGDRRDSDRRDTDRPHTYRPHKNH
ncbi:MAG: PhoH family protein [Clostridia bacterium]|nr:PhoH family protein [Clostridia bacterium]